MKSKKNIYLTLFLSSIYLSSFTFGGGYVIIPLMKNKFVDKLGLMDEKEMLNLAAIAQSSPGAVAVNAAMLVGYRLAGVGGALLTVIGTVLPPMLIILVISYFYDAFRTNTVVSAVLKGMQAGVTAVIIDVVIEMCIGVVKHREIVSIIIMAAAFIAAFFLKINVIFIILACAAAGLIKTYAVSKSSKKGGEKQ